MNGPSMDAAERDGPVDLLLVHPPVVKPCEPPVGAARLCGQLRAAGARVALWDANLDGVLALVAGVAEADGHRTRRAMRRRDEHLERLRRLPTFSRFEHYARAVGDLDHLLHRASPGGFVVGLGNLRHPRRSALRSADLLWMAEHPEENPFYPLFSARLRLLLERGSPRLAGLSLNYLSQALTAFAMLGFLRREAPGLPLVLGGGLVTSWLSQPGWRSPFGGLVDHLVAGPGEAPLLSLLGLPPAETWAMPDYSGLDLDAYLSPGPLVPFASSSGCPWHRCAFCPERVEARLYSPQPTREAGRQIRALAERWRPSLIHVSDSSVSPALLGELARAPVGAPWYGFTRVDERLADPEFCRALRRAGCEMLKLGVESGDQGVLDRLGKGIDLEVASRALRALDAAGVATYVYLLFGTPEEGPEEARRTLEFTVAHAASIDFLNLALFNLPVHDPVDLPRRSEFYEGDLSLYTAFDHPRGWDRPIVRRFVDSVFRRHPAVRPIVRRDPPIFDSNHAAYFSLAASQQRG